MGIMLILAGLTTGAAFALINNANIRATENLLDQIANGLEAYALDHAIYVPSDTARPLWYSLECDHDYADDILPKFKHHEELDDIADPLHPDQTLAHFIYRDSWKTALRYECTGNFRTAVIRSAGRDRQIGTADDITKTISKTLE